MRRWELESLEIERVWRKIDKEYKERKRIAIERTNSLEVKIIWSQHLQLNIINWHALKINKLYINSVVNLQIMEESKHDISNERIHSPDTFYDVNLDNNIKVRVKRYRGKL